MQIYSPRRIYYRIAIISVLFFFVAAMLCIIVLKLEPVIKNTTEFYARNAVGQILDEEIAKAIIDEFFSYDKFVIIERDANGQITSVCANTTLINKFNSNIGMKIGERLGKLGLVTNKIPITSLIGFDLFSGIGPKIPVRFYPLTVSNTYITHSFEEAGINQTVHTIYLTVTVKTGIMLPVGHSKIKVENTVPIAQTLIVGKIPSTYLDKK